MCVYSPCYGRPRGQGAGAGAKGGAPVLPPLPTRANITLAAAPSAALPQVGNRLYRDLSGGVPAPPHVRGLIGACSAACVLTLTMPLEVVRRRLQVQVRDGRGQVGAGRMDAA